ncbi:Hypothetical protein CINCED_3A012320, partial [Cinara cedri]
MRRPRLRRANGRRFRLVVNRLSVRARARRLLTAGRTHARPLVRGLTPGSLGWCLTLPEYQPRPGTTGAPATGPTTPRHADRTPDEPTTERRHDGDDGAGAGRTRGRNRAFRSTEGCSPRRPAADIGTNRREHSAWPSLEFSRSAWGSRTPPQRAVLFALASLSPEKRELFPDPPAASSSSFRSPGRDEEPRTLGSGSASGSGIRTGFPLAPWAIRKRLRPWYEDLSPGLGSTDSWTTAVHKKPFSTAAPEGPSRVFATTTKICTDGGSRRSRDLPFDAHRRAILLVGACRDRRRHRELVASADILRVTSLLSPHHGAESHRRPNARERAGHVGASYPEGNFGWNQLLDGSISLSPLYPAQTIDLHVRIAADLHQESLRTSIRVSPDFILARHSSPSFGYQRVRSGCAPGRPEPTWRRRPRTADQRDFKRRPKIVADRRGTPRGGPVVDGSCRRASRPGAPGFGAGRSRLSATAATNRHPGPSTGAQRVATSAYRARNPAGLYHQLRAALSSNQTRRRGPIPGRYDGPTGLAPSAGHGPVQGRLGPSRAPRQRGRPVRHNSHTCRGTKVRGGIRRWAFPCSLAATGGIT